MTDMTNPTETNRRAPRFVDGRANAHTVATWHALIRAAERGRLSAAATALVLGAPPLPHLVIDCAGADEVWTESVDSCPVCGAGYGTTWEPAYDVWGVCVIGRHLRPLEVV